ncbi:RNA polymerase sigma factor [Streptomyces sp. NPDC093591]|uniref:RNA polymerase sigma factor n=1 Tax=Streptomyces sp. NPDC093591 TaxID=3366044 RepID=UPI0038134377
MSRIPPEHRPEIARLYMELSSELKGFATRLLGCSETASDITQEAFQAAAMRWGQLRSLNEQAQRAWLFKVVKNKVFDHWSSSRRHAPLPEVPDAPAAMDTPRVAVSNALLKRCWAAIDAMPPARRRVALLRWQGEWTSREIAEHLGMSAGTVRVHLHGARRVLLEKFGTEIVFPSDWWESLQEEVPSEQR